MHVTTQARITGSNHVLSVVLACGLKKKSVRPDISTLKINRMKDT